MDSFDLDRTFLITVAVIASLTRVVRLIFALLRLCVREYYDFRATIAEMKERAASARSRRKSGQPL